MRRRDWPRIAGHAAILADLFLAAYIVARVWS